MSGQMAPTAFRQTMWWSASDMKDICRKMCFGNDADREVAMNRVNSWRTKGKVPIGIDATASLLEVIKMDKEWSAKKNNVGAFSEYQMRSLYSMNIVRLVNVIVDHGQGDSAKPITTIGEIIGLPRSLIDIRHFSTHQDLPSLITLRRASKNALDFLFNHYWNYQLPLLSLPSPACPNPVVETPFPAIQGKKIIEFFQEANISLQHIIEKTSQLDNKDKKKASLLSFSSQNTPLSSWHRLFLVHVLSAVHHTLFPLVQRYVNSDVSDSRGLLWCLLSLLFGYKAGEICGVEEGETEPSVHVKENCEVRSASAVYWGVLTTILALRLNSSFIALLISSLLKGITVPEVFFVLSLDEESFSVPPNKAATWSSFCMERRVSKGLKEEKGEVDVTIEESEVEAREILEHKTGVNELVESDAFGSAQMDNMFKFYEESSGGRITKDGSFVGQDKPLPSQTTQSAVSRLFSHGLVVCPRTFSRVERSILPCHISSFPDKVSKLRTRCAQWTNFFSRFREIDSLTLAKDSVIPLLHGANNTSANPSNDATSADDNSAGGNTSFSNGKNESRSGKGQQKGNNKQGNTSHNKGSVSDSRSGECSADNLYNALLGHDILSLLHYEMKVCSSIITPAVAGESVALLRSSHIRMGAAISEYGFRSVLAKKAVECIAERKKEDLEIVFQCMKALEMGALDGVHAGRGSGRVISALGKILGGGEENMEVQEDAASVMAAVKRPREERVEENGEKRSDEYERIGVFSLYPLGECPTSLAAGCMWNPETLAAEVVLPIDEETPPDLNAGLKPLVKTKKRNIDVVVL